jgi:hypothetical protein
MDADGAWMDMGMYIGAGSSAAGWWTVIAVGHVGRSLS